MNEYRDEHDQLMETLLNEAAGGDTPPDLAERIVARAMARESTATMLAPRTIKPFWRRTALWAAAAAVILVAGGVALWSGKSYPGPTIDGQAIIAGGGSLDRGKEVATATGQSAKLTLGGYCHIELAEDTTVQLTGGVKDESIYLKNGEVTCKVDHQIGGFSVHTELGDVHVTGTEFSVKLVDDVNATNPKNPFSQGENPMTTRKMVVAVITGTVILSSPWGQTPVSAGETQVIVVPQEPTTKPAKQWTPVPGASFGAFPTTQAAADYLTKAEELLKKELNATDEQWTAMQPKIKKVIQLTTATRGITWIPKVGVLNYPTEKKASETATAMKALSKVAGEAASSDADVAAKVKDVQDAQAKSKLEFEKAQDELRAVTTPLQEAKLIEMRLLD